jgi:hypothetical protein
MDAYKINNHNDTTFYTKFTRNIFIVTIVQTWCSSWLNKSYGYKNDY